MLFFLDSILARAALAMTATAPERASTLWMRVERQRVVKEVRPKGPLSKCPLAATGSVPGDARFLGYKEA